MSRHAVKKSTQQADHHKDFLWRMEQERIGLLVYLEEERATTGKSKGFNDERRAALRHESIRERVLAKWEGEIEARAPRVLEGLDITQRRRLTQLILDSCADFDDYVTHVTHIKRCKKADKEVERRQRMLDSKLRRAVATLEELRDYAKEIDPFQSAEYISAVNQCLGILDKVISGPLPAQYFRNHLQDLETYKEFHPSTDNPLGRHLYRLYHFFRDECEKSSNESEVRAGLIHNQFWSTYFGERPFKSLRLNNKIDIGSKGCSAVRIAVSKYERSLNG